MWKKFAERSRRRKAEEGHLSPEEKRALKIQRMLHDPYPEEFGFEKDSASCIAGFSEQFSSESLPTADAVSIASRATCIAKPAQKIDLNIDELRAGWSKQQESKLFKSLLPLRERLPAFSERDRILDAVSGSRVTVISGATGCGKTTQVPQFLLNESIEKGDVGLIVCTQPRRISAVTVAERVASERGQRVGDQVGYQIRHEACRSDETLLLYCTTGVVLRWMQNDANLHGVTTLIVDEIHERNLNCDFLLVILRDLLVSRPDLRVLLMSATLNAEAFSEYFGGAPIVHIPGKVFPVEALFLADALEATGYRIRPKTVQDLGRPQWGNARYRRERMKVKKLGEGGEIGPEELMASFEGRKYPDRVVQSVAAFNKDDLDLDLVVEVVTFICCTCPPGAVLVFLPGWGPISKVHDRLNGPDGARARASGPLLLLPLHSQLPTVNQKAVFDRPADSERKIVLATNIAETSITIDDVVYVVDCGQHKEKSYDPVSNVASLLPTLIAKANCTQRQGRAGRVQPGKCFRLYPRYVYNTMPEFQLPEMLRTPLDQLCLQIRYLRLVRPDQSVAAFLHKAMNPPDEQATANAIYLLRRIGAMDRSEALTPLGLILARLPLSPQIGKALVMGCLLQCLGPVLIIVSCISHKSIFVLPLDKKAEADAAKRRFADDSMSDHFALLNAFLRWQEAKARGKERFYCWDNYLSSSALHFAARTRKELRNILRDSGFDVDDPRINTRSGDWPVVRAALASGLYPNLVRVTVGKKRSKMFMKQHGKVKIHPVSVNGFQNGWRHKWLVFNELVRTEGGLFVYDCSEVSPMALALCCAASSSELLQLLPGEFRGGRYRIGVGGGGDEDWVQYEVNTKHSFAAVKALQECCASMWQDLFSKCCCFGVGCKALGKWQDLLTAVCELLVLEDERDLSRCSLERQFPCDRRTGEAALSRIRLDARTSPAAAIPPPQAPPPRGFQYRDGGRSRGDQRDWKEGRASPPQPPDRKSSSGAPGGQPFARTHSRKKIIIRGRGRGRGRGRRDQ